MELTPRQIVHELDRYIVGQEEAKRQWRSRSETDIAEAGLVKIFVMRSVRKIF